MDKVNKTKWLTIDDYKKFMKKKQFIKVVKYEEKFKKDVADKHRRSVDFLTIEGEKLAKRIRVSYARINKGDLNV